MFFYILLSCCVVIIIVFAFFIFSCETKQKKLDTIYPPNEEKISGGKRNALLLFQPFEPLKEENKKVKDFVLDFLKENNYNITLNYPSKDINYNAKDFDVIILLAYEYRTNIGQPMLEYIEKSNFEEDNILIITMCENKYNTKLRDKLKESIDDSNNIFITKVYDTSMNDLDNLLKTYFK